MLNVYGATEVNLIAVECPRAAGPHVAEDLVIVEVVDADNRPVPPGRTGEKVLITTLFNRGMPFIRYELPDLVAVADGPCPCGCRGLGRAAVQGRQQDVLGFPAREGLEHALEAAGAVVERLSIEPVREIARSGGGAKANTVSIAP